MVGPMIGNGKLEYSDGSTFEVDADVRFRRTGGLMSGEGSVSCPEILSLAMRSDSPTLSVADQKFRVIITRATGDGRGYVKTSGGPITD